MSVWEIKDDPPLSKNGLQQASFAGKQFAKYFKNNDLNFDEIIIESSPFLRCVQTASRIAEQLNVK